MGYAQTALRGISWIWALRFLTRGFSFLRIAIIARVLTPSLFGLYGIAALVLSLVEVFTESGINILIIQGNENLKKIVSTAWVVSIARGIIISLIVVLSMPLVTYFFNAPKVSHLILLVSIVPLLRGFINPSIIRFQKELEFKKEFYFRGFLFALESILAIVFVYILADPAGIIYGLIAGAAVEILLSFLLVRPTPAFSIDRKQVGMILSRGKWLTAGGVFNYLYHNADDAIIGRVLGTASLGIYDMAYRLSMLPITEVGETVSKVILPVYSKISGDRQRLKRAFLKTMLGVSVFTIPIGLVFFMFANPIILIVLGPKWIDAVPVFQVLAIFGIIRTMLSPIFSLFLSVKKQEYNTFVTFVSFIVMIATIIPFINRFGLIGAGFSVVLGSVLAFPLALFFLRTIFRGKV